MPSPVIEFRGVSKSYPIYASPSARLQGICLARTGSPSTAISGPCAMSSFQVFRGETFCIVGENGSGKSTLLQIVAGILHPTTGDVTVKRTRRRLLELGTGFNPEFSGRDNVYLNAAILGLSRKEIDAKFPQIEDFAEIGDFIDQPVKTYSSGMAVRLAFAVAIHVDPEILLVDEALAVGDIYFRQRCMRKVHELRAARRHHPVCLARHRRREGHRRPRDVARERPHQGHWLHRHSGHQIPGRDGRKRFSAYVADAPAPGEQQSCAPVRLRRSWSTIPNIDHRYGDGRAEVIGIAMLDARPAAHLSA